MKRLIIALLLSFACTFSVFAQQTLTVSGTVKDDAGEPLIGVVVAVAGTGNAAVTDLDGNYTLTKVPAGAKLEASCLGYTNVTKPAAEKVDFVLSTSTEMLSEAVVTGMTTTDKRLFTGATDQLSAVDVNISGVGEISRCSKENQPACRCRTYPEPSGQRLRSESGVPPPFSEIPSLCGWSMAS